MKILVHTGSGDPAAWIADLAALLPEAQARVWQPGDTGCADYALVWKPHPEVLRGRTGLKAIFNLGAGVDALLAQPEALPPGVPVIKLDDAGMGIQMVHYVSHAVLRHFRRLDEYARLKARGLWQELPPRKQTEHTIGVMGLGALGAQVAEALARLGFPVRGWSRSPKELSGVATFHADAGFAPFLDGLHVLVNMLPLTPGTDGILNLRLFAQLAAGAQLINVARGAHLVDEDLMQALACGQLANATLDVFRTEPLPADHPFWREPNIEITPHISALTERTESVRQIVQKIASLEKGEPVTGIIDPTRGY